MTISITSIGDQANDAQGGNDIENDTDETNRAVDDWPPHHLPLLAWRRRHCSCLETKGCFQAQLPNSIHLYVIDMTGYDRLKALHLKAEAK